MNFQKDQIMTDGGVITLVRVRWSLIQRLDVDKFYDQAEEMVFDILYQNQPRSMKLHFTMTEALVELLNMPFHVNIQEIEKKHVTFFGVEVKIIKGTERYAVLDVTFK